MHRAIVVATIGTIVAIIGYGWKLKEHETVRIQKRIVITLIWMSMIAAWPFVWRLIVEPHAVSPYVIIGLLWPVAILSLDILSMRQHTFDNHRHTRRQFMTMDANAICNLTFGIAAFLGVQQRVNPKLSQVFLWAILGCVAFIMPSPHPEGEASIDSLAFEAFQKGVLAFATGILISGVIITQSSATSSSLSSPSSSTLLSSPLSVMMPLGSSSSPLSSLTNQPSNSDPASLSSDRSSSTSVIPHLSSRSKRRIFDDDFVKELALRLSEEVRSVATRGA
jgi:hypothetical protein